MIIGYIINFKQRIKLTIILLRKIEYRITKYISNFLKKKIARFDSFFYQLKKLQQQDMIKKIINNFFLYNCLILIAGDLLMFLYI